EKAQDRILTSIDRKRFDDAFQMMMERDIEVEAVESIKKLTGSPPIIYRSDGVDRNMIEKTRDILSPWSSASRSFENLLEIVELAVIGGVKADIYIMPGMSRGLEYYTGFIFEQSLPEVDISFNGGGRYDKLVELFGGKPTPAVGCAIGISRILQYLTDKKNIKMAPERPRTLLTFLPEVEKKYVARVLGVLRSENIPVEVDVVERKIASAIDYALKNGFRFLLIVGKSEEVAGEISIRDLEKMVQVRYSLNEVEAIRKMIG
ncbi:MAG: ATP phosphoribosyltransferase regulatory subunit, partial [Candidatus Caldarchaeales archaeon]